MPRKLLLLSLVLFLIFAKGSSQSCTALGQNPGTAFPVCGTSTFQQDIVPNCGGRNVPTPGCNNAAYQDLNPFWYKFTCFQTGTLGFVIVPIDQGDDYDWQLFDITGHSPDEVYTDPRLVVACNWSGNFGNTGASSGGTSLVNCAGPAYPTFSSMPTVIKGHDYILLISHFTTFKPGDAGYSLSFGDGTSVITDPEPPAMLSARSSCAGETIYVKLNKEMKCNTLASNGSDFSISPPLANVKSATGIGCSSGFDLDSVVIDLDKPLPPGNYSLVAKNGGDGNTLLDNCSNGIPDLDSIPFVVYAIQPTPMDSLSAVLCAPDVLQLVFRNPMDCNSIAKDGSDFVVKGTQPVAVAGAYGVNCTNGLSSIIAVKLSKPIQTAGAFTLSLQTGSDGTTLLDECAQETPPATLSFTTADTVSANFNYRVGLGCVFDTLFYSYSDKNQVNQWNWTFDLNGTSTTENSYFLFNDYGSKHIQLACSNGVCTDTAAVDIALDNELLARFKVAPSPELCPEDGAIFTDSSIGKILSWHWIFGDGSGSSMENPPLKMYPPSDTRDGRIYPVSLIVKNDLGCYDTSVADMKVLYNCYIAVPSGFTPNGDGLNDYLYPLNAYKADGLEFKVYNRWGQLVFQTRDWTRKWDGKINGEPQAAGTYVWMLSYTHHDTGKHYSLKGITVLIR
ncbi:MAG TPA: gliding motility-associated C-terminal domain-containing protein [Parafilimonas sp.]|nr:gliding motility-associated C-terminal domain-containing protein [Parafilimonas sp.]